MFNDNICIIYNEIYMIMTSYNNIDDDDDDDDDIFTYFMLSYIFHFNIIFT